MSEAVVLLEAAVLEVFWRLGPRPQTAGPLGTEPVHAENLVL